MTDGSNEKRINCAYGRWSYTKHVRAARKQALAVYSMSKARPSLDIDSVEDLRALQRLDFTTSSANVPTTSAGTRRGILTFGGG
jgi:2-phospho-L-lactate guanylyltransferase (CobY/MobA/RfbA family)